MQDQSSQRARTRSRELVLQALYQAQIAGHDKTELLRPVSRARRMSIRRVDQIAILRTLLDGNRM